MTQEEIDALKNDLSSFMLLGHLSNFIVFPVPNIDFFTMEGLPDFEPFGKTLDFLTTTREGSLLKKQVQGVLNDKAVEYLTTLFNTGLFYVDNVEDANALLSSINASLEGLSETENAITADYLIQAELSGPSNINYGPETNLYDDGIFVSIIDSFKG